MLAQFIEPKAHREEIVFLFVCLGIQELQVVIPCIIHGQQDKMMSQCPVLYLRSLAEIKLASQDRLDTLPITFLIKVHDATHGSMVGQGEGCIAQLLCSRDHLRYRLIPIKCRIMTMIMQ